MTESASPVKTATPMLGHALLVGVEDYRAYDPSGKRNLLSGRNDVLAFWKVCRKLRYEPQNILLLTSPILTEDDLVWAERELAPILHEGKTPDEIRALVRGWLSGDPPAPGETEESFRRRFERWTSERASSGAPARVFRGEATSWAVRQGAGWLAASLIVNPGLGLLPIPGISLPGFFSYSGHGATKNGKLALCPGDVTSDLDGALLLEDMGKIFGGTDLERRDDVRPTDNLTIVLDCCFAGAGDAAGGAQRVSGLGAPSGEGAHPSEIGNRVFCAAGPHEQACQAMLGGYWYGAFTWALTVALEQWTMEPEGLSWMSRVSHTELLFRARMLLRALSFRQHPMLLDGGGIGNEPVFRHGRGGGEKARLVPDEDRPGVQLDPSGDHDYTVYTLRDWAGTVYAEIVVVQKDIKGWSVNREYWKVHKALDTSKVASGMELLRHGRSDLDGLTWAQPSPETATFSFWRQGDWRSPLAGEYPDLLNGGGFGFSAQITASTAAIRWYHVSGSNLFAGSSSVGSWAMQKPSAQDRTSYRFSHVAINAHP